jgi:hypothetical protein
MSGRVREERESQCQREIKLCHLAKGPDQGEAWEEAEAGVEVEDAGQARAATACVRIAGNELPIRRETPVLIRNVPNAELLWRGSSYGSLHA